MEAALAGEEPAFALRRRASTRGDICVAGDVGNAEHQGNSVTEKRHQQARAKLVVERTSRRRGSSESV
jgi:hypothetical protein